MLQQESSKGLGLLHPAGFLVNTLGFGTGVMLLIWGLVHEPTWLARILGSKLMILMGKSSYAFFLIHYTFIVGLVAEVAGDSYIRVFIRTWILSVLVYYFVEKPVSLMLSKLYSFLG